MENLPDEILINIFVQLDSKSLKEVALVCQRFKRVVLDFIINRHLVVFTDEKTDWFDFPWTVFKRIDMLSVKEKITWNELVKAFIKNKTELEELHLRVIAGSSGPCSKLAVLLKNVKILEIMPSNRQIKIYKELLAHAENIQSLTLNNMKIEETLFAINSLKNIRELRFPSCSLEIEDLLKILENLGDNLVALDIFSLRTGSENQRRVLKAISTKAAKLKELHIVLSDLPLRHHNDKIYEVAYKHILQLKNLEHFHVKWEICYCERVFNIISQMTYLKLLEISWHHMRGSYCVAENRMTLAEAIIGMKNLNELHFNKMMQFEYEWILRRGDLKKICENLPNLRLISRNGIKCDKIITMFKSMSLEDYNALLVLS